MCKSISTDVINVDITIRTQEKKIALKTRMAIIVLTGELCRF